MKNTIKFLSIFAVCLILSVFLASNYHQISAYQTAQAQTLPATTEGPEVNEPPSAFPVPPSGENTSINSSSSLSNQSSEVAQNISSNISSTESIEFAQATGGVGTESTSSEASSASLAATIATNPQSDPNSGSFISVKSSSVQFVQENTVRSGAATTVVLTLMPFVATLGLFYQKNRSKLKI